MLIETITLEGLGPFRERLVLGPLKHGLNILAQPNEWGKSTLVKALSHTLFDRYGSESKEIRQLRPAGSSLSPQIDLIFRCQGERFRLAKGFLDRKGCELFRWQTDRWERTDESDRADQRLRELLGAPPLEGRVAKPETWGFLRYLWARQDEPADWPDWSGPSGAATRRKLATVEIDAAVRSLLSILKARGEVLFTPTGKKVRTGSPLEFAEAECEQIRKELAEIHSRRAALESLQQQHARMASELPLLDRERVTKAEEAAQVRAQAEAADKLRATIAVLEADLARIDTQLQQLRRDKETLQGVAESERLAILERERLTKARDEAAAQLPVLEAALARAQAEARERKKERTSLEQRMQRHRGLLRLRQHRDELARMQAQRERIAAAAAELQRLEEALARIPSVSAAKLKQWREWERSLREDRVRLESMGLRVTLKPKNAAAVKAQCDGVTRQVEASPAQPETVHATQSLVLHLDQWGVVEIASGASEPAALQAAVAQREETLARAFAEARVGSLPEAETASEQARTLEQQVRSAKQTLTASLGEWETFPRLESAITRVEAVIAQETDLLKPTPQDDTASLIALQDEEQAFTASLESAATRQEESAVRVEQAREAMDVVRQRREDYAAQFAGLEARVRGLVEQREMILARYPQGLAPTLEQVQTDWVRAEARLVDAKRQMPPQAERLPERSQRLARAAAEIDAAYQKNASEIQRLEVQLEERGADGLYSRESELEEKLVRASAEAARLRQEGYAARLLGELIQQRERTAVKLVLGPLETRLSEVFAGLTGVSTRRVWFDETLQVRGIGAREEELVRFDDLSRGAREQLLLALRAAIALELAGDGPQCLVLDDVLVNTDAVRQQNVLDYLQELSGQLQIIVLTCHAERYRGVGHVLTPEWIGRDGSQ